MSDSASPAPTRGCGEWLWITAQIMDEKQQLAFTSRRECQEWKTSAVIFPEFTCHQRQCDAVHHL